eukprot:CAMPEP_0171862788 /NCGR_PEP_ID=MMETSP0992-20121227/27883_1 /TAXON_ID=483369 /ORGANISM="non described non described, Strain CCMP2098" /LENGTH=64 /DNA_ID=CAMNT_0012485061 /DNA_START=95 /DNA_END=286 /DNA_ORIENTATION=-
MRGSVVSLLVLPPLFTKRSSSSSSMQLNELRATVASEGSRGGAGFPLQNTTAALATPATVAYFS